MASHIQGFPHIRMFLHCWAKDNSQDSSRLPISVPPTLVFEHGVPKAVLLPEDELSDFVTAFSGGGTSSFEAEFDAAQQRYLEDREYLKQASTADIPEPHISTARRSPKDISQPMLLAAMSNPVMAPGISDPEAVVAYFVGLSEGFGGEARVDIRYMNREQVKRFFSKRELPDREGNQVQLTAGETADGAATKQSAIMADCRVRDRISEVMEVEQQWQQEHEHRHDALFLNDDHDQNSCSDLVPPGNCGNGAAMSPLAKLLKRQQDEEEKATSKQLLGADSRDNDDEEEEYEVDPRAAEQARLRQRLAIQTEISRVARSPHQSGLSPPPSPGSLSLQPPPSSGPQHQQQQQRDRSPNRDDTRVQLTGILQRFEYTPSHHSEIVTMRWTRSYCDFERIRNSVLLEDRSRRAAERGATVDAPPTLVRRYSVTARMKTLMRFQADLLADRFNAGLLHAGRSFVLTQATFLFRMGFHGHVHFLWCSKMQLEKHHHHHPHAGPGHHDWHALVRRPPWQQQQQDQHQHQNQLAGEAQHQEQQQQQNQQRRQAEQQEQELLKKRRSSLLSGNGDDILPSGSSPINNNHNMHSMLLQQQYFGQTTQPQLRYHPFGRRFLDIGQTMLDREQMLRNRGLSRELGDLDDPVRAEVSDGSDDDDGGRGKDDSSSPKKRVAKQQKKSSFRLGTATTTSSSGGGGGGDGDDRGAVRAGTGLMPLYSEHRIAVTQAQRHLGRPLPVPTSLLTNIIRRDRTKTAEVLAASRSLRANRDTMLEILRKADFSLHGRFERPKVKDATHMTRRAMMMDEQERKHSKSPDKSRRVGGGASASPTSSSFIKEDEGAGTIEAKMIRLLGRQGRQAARMMPDLIAQLERERKAGGAEQLAQQEKAAQQEEKRRQLQLEFERAAEEAAAATARPREQKQKQAVSSRVELFSETVRDEESIGDDDDDDRDDDDDDAERGNARKSAPDAIKNNSSAGSKIVKRPKMILMRSVMSSWKSWVNVYYARMQKHFSSSSSPNSASFPLHLSRPVADDTLSIVSGTTDDSNTKGARKLSAAAAAAADAHSLSIRSIPASVPLAASVPVELLELHFRQFSLSMRSAASPTTSGIGHMSRSNNHHHHHNQSPATRCLDFWAERFESAGVTRCSAVEAAAADKAVGQHHHVDDTALHNCRVINAADIFCFLTPTLDAAEAVCKMIQNACVFA